MGSNSFNIKQCAWCRKVKNIDTDIWNEEIIDIILDVSHSICPDCKKDLWEEYRMVILKGRIENLFKKFHTGKE